MVFTFVIFFFSQYLLNGANVVVLCIIGLLTLCMHGAVTFNQVWLSQWTSSHNATLGSNPQTVNETREAELDLTSAGDGNLTNAGMTLVYYRN